MLTFCQRHSETDARLMWKLGLKLDSCFKYNNGNVWNLQAHHYDSASGFVVQCDAAVVRRRQQHQINEVSLTGLLVQLHTRRSASWWRIARCRSFRDDARRNHMMKWRCPC